MAPILKFAILLLIVNSAMVNSMVLAGPMANVARVFEANTNIPGVDSKAPQDDSSVYYANVVPASLGNVLTPTQARNIPSGICNSDTLAMNVEMSVASAFEASKIVPDVIPSVPSELIELKYPSGVSANLGNELAPTNVRDQPTVSYKADPDAFYTLVFTDPDNYDGPEPVYREWHHWLVGNIPGGDVSRGEVLSGYIGSGPPEGTGIHRYVYILYRQPGKLAFDEARLTNKSIDGRAAFSTKKFAEKYNLGAPVAGNFYRAQFDDYVPLLYKSLGENNK